MIKYLHRHTFSEIQSHLFPIYFVIQGITSIAQLLVYCFLKDDLAKLTREHIQMVGDSLIFIHTLKINFAVNSIPFKWAALIWSSCDFARKNLVDFILFFTYV